MSNLSKFDPSFGASNTRYLIDGNDTITGYLKCDGAILSQATYSSLFAKVGLIQDGNVFKTWTRRTPGTVSVIRALTYADGLYVYGGDGGVLGTSTDAITWTIRTPGTTTFILALTYADGLYVYVGTSGVLGTSTNAITWTLRTSGTVNQINALTYADGLYVYGGNFGAIVTSTDAITWTIRTSNTTSSIRALTYADGLYVYGGDGGVLGIADSYLYNSATEFVLPGSEQINQFINTANLQYSPAYYIKSD